MRTWLDEVVSDRDAQQSEKEQRERERREKFERRHLPMTERLRRIIVAMPAEEQVKPRPLTFFTEALAPKFHGRRAAPREVATALRQLGWTRHRQWRGGAPFVALWYPPGADAHDDTPDR